MFQRSEKSTAETFSFRSFLLCEDIRIETTGKEILIGVYSGSVTTTQLPVFFPMLAFRLEVMASKSRYDLVNLEIKKPDGTVLFATRTNCTNPQP